MGLQALCHSSLPIRWEAREETPLLFLFSAIGQGDGGFIRCLGTVSVLFLASMAVCNVALRGFMEASYSELEREVSSFQ